MDSDSDGMPDDWVIAYGLDPNLDDTDQDPDGDGFTNLEEYLGNSDSNDANSRPAIALPPARLLLLR